MSDPTDNWRTAPTQTVFGVTHCARNVMETGALLRLLALHGDFLSDPICSSAILELKNFLQKLDFHLFKL